MPVVPKLNPQPVRQQAVSNVRVSTDAPLEAFGGGQAAAQAGRAAGQSMDLIAQIESQERQRAREIRLSEERRALNDWELANVYDPQKGAISKMGKNAFSVQSDLEVGLNGFIEERTKGLPDEETKAKFMELVQGRREQVMKWAAGHVFQQTKAVEEAEFTSSLESSKERASVNKAAIPLETTMIRQKIMQRSQDLGWDQETTAQQLRAHESDLHSRVIHSILKDTKNGGDLQAQRYFDQVKDRLDPDVAQKVGQSLEEGMVRGESQRRSDDIARRSGSLSEAMRQVKTIEDPKLRDATMERVKSEFALREAVKKERIDEMHRNAANIIDQRGSIDEIPVQQWSQFSLSERAALKNYAEHRSKGTQPETDWGEYSYLNRLATTAPEEFGRINLFEKYRGVLADTEYKEMEHLQRQLGKKDPETEKILDGVRSKNAIVDQTLRDIGINPNPQPDSEDASKVKKFWSKVEEKVRQIQTTTGKKVTNEQMQQVVDSLAVRGVTEKGFLWDTKKRAFELEPGEEFAVEPSEVPETEKQKIMEALQRRGVPVNDETISALYSRKVKGR